jgi:hypothetical protein
MMKVFLLGTSVLFASLWSAVGGEVIFSDDFDRDSSADWIVIEDSLNSTPDATVIFGHDYSQDLFKITRGANTETLTVPKNPFDLGETTVALKLFVNSDDEAAEASVSLFPRNLDVQGDHSLRFEMFMSYNGPAYGGSGSTEFFTMGIGHSGELVASLDGNEAVDGDGTFFAVSGEGGASRDFRAYVGDGFSLPELLDEQLARVGFTDMDGDGIGEYNTFVGGPLERVFPFPPHETEGAPGKGWVQAEVRREGDTVSWILNGQIIATLGADQVLADGKRVMIGYSDPFSSIANPGAENFVIIDNLRVVQLEAEDLLPVVGVAVAGAVVFDEELSADVFRPDPVGEGAGAASFLITRTGATTEPLAISFRVEGSALAGKDYERVTPSEITFAAGESETTLSIVLIDDAEEEFDETIEVVINSSPSYETRENKFAILPLVDNGDNGIPVPDILVDAELVFSEAFDADVSTEWLINQSSDDTTAVFGYDYSIDGIPPAPGTKGESTLGLKFTANESLGEAAHITASPVGQTFAGDYVLTFDLWLNFNGPIPGGGAGSTEFAAAGIGTSGDHIQTGDDASDGAWFLVTGDGGSSRDFRLFLDNVFLTEDSGVYLAGSQDSASDYYGSIFPSGKTATEAQMADFLEQSGSTASGQVAFEWVPVQIAKVGNTVTWSMKGSEIAKASQSDALFADSGNLFLGYSDWFSSVSDNLDLSYGLFDNVNVYQLAKLDPVELSIAIALTGTDVVITYSGKLESASAVAGDWVSIEGATSPYQQTIDPTKGTQFFRVVE